MRHVGRDDVEIVSRFGDRSWPNQRCICEIRGVKNERKRRNFIDFEASPAT